MKHSGIYAASICVTYEWPLGSDYIWYLPSTDELNKLYNQRNVIGGFSDGDYWSSTEFDTTKAWLKDFSDGKETASDNHKFTKVTLCCRYIRQRLRIAGK